MASYAFFFNRQTFEMKKQEVASGSKVEIDYVGMAEKRPYTGFVLGDELFIVGVFDGRVALAGRMIAGGQPMPRDVAIDASGRHDLISGKELICFAKEGTIDEFRCSFYVPSEMAESLELYTVEGDAVDCSSLRAGQPDPNLFRACPRLSERSAEQLRSLLGIGTKEADVDSELGDGAIGLDSRGVDDEEYRLRAIKSRRGQARFRQALLEAYKGRCVVTGCNVADLLEAAHITPHAELTDYRVCNGLLLRADIHTLFDLNLLAIDERYRVKLSSSLRYTEYWEPYRDRQLTRLPDKSADQPLLDALRLRMDMLRT